MRQLELLVRVKLTNQYKEIDIGFRRSVRAIRKKEDLPIWEIDALGLCFYSLAAFTPGH
jgi:hypothetical protein